MNRYPARSPSSHSLPSRDFIPPWGRVLLYALAIVAPGAGLLLGKLDADETLAAAVALAGIIGPVVATIQERKIAEDEGAHFRAGYGAAVAEHVQGSQAVVVPADQVNKHEGER